MTRQREFNAVSILTIVVCLAVAGTASTFPRGVGIAGSVGRHRHNVAASPNYYPRTGFGGYHWSGHVTQISAQWSVPKIAAGSRSGYAGTWIGVQGAKSRFIQIGVIEGKYGNGQSFYDAFWSDTAKQFATQDVGSVRSGEQIFASMQQTSVGWRLALRNKSGTLRFTKLLAYGTDQKFTMGMWFLENPPPSLRSTKDAPFPTMANVRFRDLLVNQSAPRLQLSNEQVLTASTGQIRIPTPVQRDSFTFSRPHGYALQYLEDARLFDVNVSTFDEAWGEWNKLRVAVRRTDIRTFERAIALNVSRFSSQSWSTGSRRAIGNLLAISRHELRDLKSWQSTDYRTSGSGYATIVADLKSFALVIKHARRSLGLPPF